MGPESTNITAIHPSALDHAYSIGHPLLDTPITSKAPSTPRDQRERHGAKSSSEVASVKRKLSIMSKHDVYELVPATNGRKVIGPI